MAFIIWNPATTCAHRAAGRALCRRAALGGISLATLSELLGCERLVGAWK